MAAGKRCLKCLAMLVLGVVLVWADRPPSVHAVAQARASTGAGSVGGAISGTIESGKIQPPVEETTSTASGTISEVTESQEISSPDRNQEVETGAEEHGPGQVTASIEETEALEEEYPPEEEGSPFPDEEFVEIEEEPEPVVGEIGSETEETTASGRIEDRAEAEEGPGGVVSGSISPAISDRESAPATAPIAKSASGMIRDGDPSKSGQTASGSISGGISDQATPPAGKPRSMAAGAISGSIPGGTEPRTGSSSAGGIIEPTSPPRAPAKVAAGQASGTIRQPVEKKQSATRPKIAAGKISGAIEAGSSTTAGKLETSAQPQASGGIDGQQATPKVIATRTKPQATASEERIEVGDLAIPAPREVPPFGEGEKPVFILETERQGQVINVRGTTNLAVDGNGIQVSLFRDYKEEKAKGRQRASLATRNLSLWFEGRFPVDERKWFQARADRAQKYPAVFPGIEEVDREKVQVEIIFTAKRRDVGPVPGLTVYPIPGTDKQVYRIIRPLVVPVSKLPAGKRATAGPKPVKTRKADSRKPVVAQTRIPKPVPGGPTRLTIKPLRWSSGPLRFEASLKRPTSRHKTASRTGLKVASLVPTQGQPPLQVEGLQRPGPASGVGKVSGPAPVPPLPRKP